MEKDVSIDRLNEEIAARKKAEEEKESLLQYASELVKGLNCLYGLAQFVEKYVILLEKILQGTVNLIPPAWQYPEITCSRIVFDGKEYKTDDFKDTKWKQSTDIMVYGNKRGVIEVCYLEERPRADEGPFLNGERRLLGAVAERLGRVAEQKQAEEDLVKAKRLAEDNYHKLKELERLKDGLTHMIVHDLNNPLSVMLGFVQLLKIQSKEMFTQHQKQNLERVLSAGGELKRMVGDLLDINKMEEGKIKLRYEDFNLGDTAKEVVEQMNIIASGGGKTLSSEVINGIPAISADKELIRRVVGNLVNNALKFTPPKGSVYLRLLYKKDDNSVHVQVKDTGSGIPKEYLNKIFDKFVQVESKKAKAGRGLGLAFCKMAVEAHGGRIWVESEPDKGSTFIFTLPCKK